MKLRLPSVELMSPADEAITLGGLLTTNSSVTAVSLTSFEDNIVDAGATLVDVVAADAMRLCDEGLAIEIDADTQLAPAPDGTPASVDFGDLKVSECFVPNIVYSTTFGYRTDMVGDTPPTTIADVFDLKKYPGKRALQKKPIDNLEWALIADGVPGEKVYEVLATEAGVDRAFAWSARRWVSVANIRNFLTSARFLVPLGITQPSRSKTCQSQSMPIGCFFSAIAENKRPL